MAACLSSRIAMLLAMAALPMLAQTKYPPAKTVVEHRGGRVILRNGFVQASFDPAAHRIVDLSADHDGRGRFHGSLLGAGGITFDGKIADSSAATITFPRPSRGWRSLRAKWKTGAILHTVELSLGPNDRGVKVVSSSTGSDNSVVLSFRQWLILGIFDRGVVQNVAGQSSQFSSQSPLRLFYTSDKSSGSVALAPQLDNSPAESVLTSGGSLTDSGLELHTTPSAKTYDQWSQISKQRPPLRAESHDTPSNNRELRFTLFANDLPYPAMDGPNPIASSNEHGVRDSQAILTAVYSTAAAVLGTYQQPGSAYPTLASPLRTYGDAFDFFDPDAWPVVNTLSYSGNALLQHEARKIIERSEREILPDGQLPHHFELGRPVYVSIARSTQSGPNLFWVLAAVDYASATGDERWLRDHYPAMKKATEWLLARFDPAENLINIDGPLFIDVFRRSGYTLDTNAMAIRLMEAMAESSEVCGDPVSAGRYRDLAASLRTGLYQHLWDGRDHFITERHPDGSMRDFVDYDGNLAAIDFGALQSEAEEHAVLRRIDSNPLTHPGGRGTWVSERRYEKSECYGGNDGDSDVAMGRIWWLDMLARTRLGDRATFDKTLDAIEGDLLRDVWMNERYDSTGKPAHSPYYHEYPEIVSMVLRELRYGVQLGPREVRVIPFGPRRFTMRLGALMVDYSQKILSIYIPGSSEKSFLIAGLLPDTAYRLNAEKTLRSDPSGRLRFVAHAGSTLQLHAITRSSHRIRKDL